MFVFLLVVIFGVMKNFFVGVVMVVNVFFILIIIYFFMSLIEGGYGYDGDVDFEIDVEYVV